ncbi:hypothetical protein SUGI_0346920 [Cryptomeria japonica]|nr:hypothetical protein SUGI_0346920 [Cryptomeria japonica]
MDRQWTAIIFLVLGLTIVLSDCRLLYEGEMGTIQKYKSRVGIDNGALCMQNRGGLRRVMGEGDDNTSKFPKIGVPSPI